MTLYRALNSQSIYAHQNPYTYITHLYINIAIKTEKYFTNSPSLDLNNVLPINKRNPFKDFKGSTLRFYK